MQFCAKFPFIQSVCFLFLLFLFTDYQMKSCEYISQCLDILGYSQEMIEYRRKLNKDMDNIYNRKPFAFRNLTVGAKAEGTALYYESDIDRLYEAKAVCCVEQGTKCISPTVFHLDRTGCSPGYTRLKIFRIHPVFKQAIEKYCVSENGIIFISNEFRPFEDTETHVDINGISLNKQETKGPSSPFGNMYISYDFVLGFKSSCNDLIRKWVARQRKYNWPDQILIKRISRMEGHVVPVANKGSRYPSTEWRICFTNAELALVRSFTNIQVKLYILLKLVAKSVLRPVCVEMSSYIMKNVVLWMVETTPPEAFAQAQLIDRLIDALLYLKDCLLANNLRSYMVEDRNLFEGRILADKRAKLLDVLDGLIAEKELVLQRCDKIRIGLQKLATYPEDFKMESYKRDEIEKLILKTNVIFKKFQSPLEDEGSIKNRLENNELYQIYKEELHNHVVPDRDTIVTRGQDAEEVYRDRLFALLS